MLQLTLTIGLLVAALHIIPRIVLHYRRRQLTDPLDRPPDIIDYPELSIVFVGLLGAMEFLGAPPWLMPFALLFVATRAVTAAGRRVPAPIRRWSIMLAIFLLLVLILVLVMRGMGYL